MFSLHDGFVSDCQSFIRAIRFITIVTGEYARVCSDRNHIINTQTNLNPSLFFFVTCREMIPFWKLVLVLFIGFVEAGEHYQFLLDLFIESHADNKWIKIKYKNSYQLKKIGINIWAGILKWQAKYDNYFPVKWFIYFFVGSDLFLVGEYYSRTQTSSSLHAKSTKSTIELAGR